MSSLEELLKKISSGTTDVEADDMRLVADAITELREHVIFSPEIHDGSFPFTSEADYIIALSHLEIAANTFRKVASTRAREIAGGA